MCGICGYIRDRKLDDAVLERMRDTMIHRGPDDAGIWQGHFEDKYIGLAHRRLSIFDLSELGHQPMISEDGKYAIAYNGEVYNFKEIREELKKEGYFFQSECDTEVVLKAFICWKEECFKKFNGMFAISIWDGEEGRLILARDRMGVKPLYYYHKPGTCELVYASELKPIMKYPDFHKEIRMDMLGKFLCYKYIAAPDTIFENTYKLVPGTYLIFNGNSIKVDRYWDILEEKQKRTDEQCSDVEKCKTGLDDLLTDAVNIRLAADVPVGVFLSSGIDSALITAIAQKNCKTPVQSFTIGFTEKERNEADKAAKIARFLGTNHTELYIGEKDIFNMLEDISKYYDEPFSDASMLPTMLVSKLAQEKVTVALSGDGGDELFCGYNMYDLVYIAQKVDWIGNILYHIPGLGRLCCSISPEIKAFINNRGDYRSQLFIDVTSEQVKRVVNTDSFYPKHEIETKLKYGNWQERRMVLDMMTYLPDEIMEKTDRASMKYSLEIRSPLLDYRVVENSFFIPQKFKYYHRNKKYILKELAYDYIPRELLKGAKKGFGVPLVKWLRGPLKEEISRYSEKSFLDGQGIFDSKGIQDLVRTQERDNKIIYSSILWSFYMFQRWWDGYM